MNIKLPQLSQYKHELLQKGIRLPLETVKNSDNGLLKQLPVPPQYNTGWPWTEEVKPFRYDYKIKWPKITIVTPSYNQDKFIEQTIRSVLLQNYPNLEYIIIDGGSTDHTINVLEKYSQWISYWKSEKDSGQSYAINKGFSMASGDYYAWINSDDYYLPDTFLKVILKFIKTRSDFIYGYSLSVEENKIELIKTLPLLDFLIRMPTLQQPACFWSSKIHQPIWEDLVCSLDYELWLRLVKGQKRKMIRTPLAAANVHKDAKTHNPEMGYSWKRDHELICSESAHGEVKNWHLVYFFHRIWVKLNKLYTKVW